MNIYFVWIMQIATKVKIAKEMIITADGMAGICYFVLWFGERPMEPLSGNWKPEETFHGQECVNK
jgi:hypothetical protein